MTKLNKNYKKMMKKKKRKKIRKVPVNKVIKEQKYNDAEFLI